MHDYFNSRHEGRHDVETLPNGVRILLAREDYPDLVVDTPLLDEPTPDGRRQRERLSEMLHDLERLRGGWTPGARDLAAAPRLENWRAADIFGSRLPALLGRCAGHPILGARMILKSPLVAFDGEGLPRAGASVLKPRRPFGRRLRVA